MAVQRRISAYSPSWECGRHEAELFQVDVRGEETVEYHYSLGSGSSYAVHEIDYAGKMGAYLYGYGYPKFRSYRADHTDIAVLDGGGRCPGI